MSTAFRSVGLLDVVSTTPPGPSGRAPCIHARLHPLATNPGEKCGLTRRILSAFLAAVVSLGILLPSAAPAARNIAAELRKERGRLLEMKNREEKTVRELTEALRKEKLSKGRVGELRERLKRQRALLSRIDRKVSALNERLDRAEKAVRELEEEHGQARTGLLRAEVVAFTGQRVDAGNPWDPSARERERYFMRMRLAADAEGVARITRARERKEEELSGIERQVAVTERKRTQEKKVGETLLSRQEEERSRLAGIEREKKRKQKELKSLRARIARMEAVVSRVERQVKERERRARKGAPDGAARKAAEAPQRFASLAGGLSAPLPGKVVTRFGRQHDPTFDVTIENRGVEIEAPSGASVKSVGKGEVAFAGAVSGFGNVLIVQHGGGLFSVYGRMETFLVKQGEAVRKGAVVGRLPESPSGKSVLYLELRAGGTAVDPSSAMSLDR
jgi:septal ring factor EnvC (AmiA/AmiB activator)